MSEVSDERLLELHEMYGLGVRVGSVQPMKRSEILDVIRELRTLRKGAPLGAIEHTAKDLNRPKKIRKHAKTKP